MRGSRGKSTTSKAASAAKGSRGSGPLAAARLGGRSSRFCVITDLHLRARDRRAAATLCRDMRRAAALAPASGFILAAGDLTEDGRLDSLKAVQAAFEQSPLPVIPMFGGHDGREECKVFKLPPPWTQHYAKVFGPLWYSFEAGRCHVVVYANEDHHFTPEMNRIKSRWLARDLSSARRANRPTVVALHAPPTLELSRRLSRFGVAMVVCGHWHTLKHWRVGATQFSCAPPLGFGGIDMMPRGVRAVEVSSTRSTVRYRPAAMPAPVHVRSRAIWTRPFGGYAHRAGVVKSEDRLLGVINRDHDGEGCRIFCVDADTGRSRWKLDVPEAVKHRMVICGQRVLFTTQPGVLVCADLASGGVRWSRRLQQYPNRWLHAPPAVIDDIVIAGTHRGGLEGFALATGRRLWALPPLPGKPTVSGDIWPWAAEPAGLAGSALYPGHDIGLTRFDASTGKAIWQLDCPYRYHMPGPLRVGDYIWCPAAAPAGEFLQMNAHRGEIVRRVRSARVPIAWTLHEEHLVVAATDAVVEGVGWVECRSALDGRLLWQRKTGRSRIGAHHYSRNGPNLLAAPVICGGIVYQACTDGGVRTFDLTDGKPRRPLRFGGPLFASPIIEHDRCWAMTWHGRVSCTAIDV